MSLVIKPMSEDVEKNMQKAKELEAQAEKLREMWYDRNNRFIVSFDDSLYDMYMDTIKELSLEDAFEIETIDTWRGVNIPRVYTLLKNINNERKAEIELSIKILDSTMKKFKPLTQLSERMAWPLMAIPKSEESLYRPTLLKRRGKEFMLADITISSQVDKDGKKYLYWSSGESYMKKMSDLPNFLADLVTDENYSKMKNTL